MNKIFRIVWSKALKQFVVVSELATSSASGTQGPSTGPRKRSAMFLSLALMLASFGASAADIQNIGFEDGTLTGWTAGGGTGAQDSASYGANGVGASIVTGMTDFYSDWGPTPSTHEWTVTPYGSYMASLQAGPQSNNVAAGMGALGLTAQSQQEVASMMGRSLSGLKNAAWLYQDLVLGAGDSFTMAWQYVSTDYEPFNDGSLTSLVNVNDPFALGVVNNQNAQFALLGATNLGTGSYSTGDYGATGWQVATYSVTTAGTYRLGFFTFNIDDQFNSPVLLIDQAPGLTFDHGVPFGPVAPNPGSGAPTTPGIPTTAVIDDTMGTDELDGASDGAFEGGTLVVDADGTDVDLDFTIDGTGGTIDQNGHDATFSGVISDADNGTPGDLTITNGGNGGSVTLTGENTYTGTTVIDNGATLALSGDGSIEGSDVVNHGTFDIEDANGDVNVKSLTGGNTGEVALGDNSLVLTEAHGDFGGTIGGNGGVNVEAGTQTLSGENTYTGTTVIDNGATLALSGDGSIEGSDVVNHGTFDIEDANGDVNVKSLTGGNTGDVALGDNSLVLTDAHGDFGGTIGGNGGVNVEAGTQTLSGENTYTGTTVIDDGATLALSGDGSIEGSDVVNHGTFDIEDANGDVNVKSLTGGNTGDVALGDNGLVLTDAHGDFGGTIGGNGGVTIEAGTQTFSGCNSYSGSTVIRAGSTLAIAGQGGVANSDVVADGAFDIAQADGDVGAQSLTGEGTVGLGGNTLVLADAQGEFGGAIGGTGGLTIDGGHQTLTGNNTYDGTTTIADGATLTLAGEGSIAGSDVVADGRFDLGAADQNANVKSLTGSGAVELGGNSLQLTDANGDFGGVIAGQGGVNIAGGTQTFSGCNTYTGATVIDRGATLALAGQGCIAGSDVVADGTFDIAQADGEIDVRSLTGDGDVALGGNTLVLTNANGDFGGSIDGTGSVKITGGTQSLSGENTFSGGLVVNGGTLQVSSDANLGNGTVSIGNGTLQTTGGFTSDNDFALTSSKAIVDTAGHDVTLNGNLSGDGVLNKIGDGTLTLKGQNTQDGISVKGGAVEFDSDAALGRDGSVVTIADNTTLRTLAAMDIRHEIFVDNTRSAVFDTNGFDVSVSGDIGGSGIVQKLGGGVLTLSGKNSQVLMQVQGGSIAVTSQEAAGAMGGDIYIGQDGNFTALSGMNVTQNVHVTGGNARFETRGAPVTLSGNLDGSACLIKAGAGRLDMRGGGSNAIGACIEQGDLGFNSTFTGNVWVYADGTASGSGRVEGAMDVKGVLSPGNSPGALVVAGSVLQHAGSTFVADVDGRTAGNGAGHYDTLTLVGAGSVYTAAGELQPRLRGITGDATNTFVPTIGDTFAIVRAEGGVAGSYDSLAQPQAGLPANARFDVRYEANSVVLAVTPDSYAAAMGTFNTASVGNAIDAVRAASGVRNTGDAARLQDSLMGLNLAGTASALEQLDGEFHATARTVLADDARRVREATLDRMRGGRSPVERTQQPGDAVWAQVLASGGSLDGDGNAAGADYNGSGLLIGAEHRFDGGWQIGAMAGSERTDMDVADRASNGDADTLHFGLYADRNWGAFAVRGGVGVAQHSIDSQRIVNLPNLSQRLVADYDAQTRQAYVEAGYSVEGKAGSLQPYLQFARVETQNDAFSETGGSLALDVAKDKTTLDVSTLGVRGELSLTSAGTGDGWFNVRGGLGWRHASGDIASESRMGWTSGGDFTVAGAPLAEDAAVVEVGVAAWLSPRTLLEVGYEGQYADEARDHQATARLSVRF